MKKKLLVVLGMHRSGTSAIARGLKAFNVDLGENLLEPVADNNEKGFWEDKDIYNFNERLLEKLGKKWHSLKITECKTLLSDNLFQEKSEALELLNKKIESSALFGIKDPRFSILLPFWKRIFEDLSLDVGYIISVRDPFEVALSLENRDQFSQEKSLALWASHMLCAVEYTRNDKKVFVDYDLLLNNPLKEISRISKAFNLNISTADDPALNEYVHQFLTKELKHHTIAGTSNRALSAAENWIKTLHHHLRKNASDENKNGIDLYSKFYAEFFSLDALFEKIDSLELIAENLFYEKIKIELGQTHNLSELKSEITQKNNQLNELKSEISQRNHHAIELQEDLDEKSHQIRDLQRTVNELFSSTSWKISAPVRYTKAFTTKGIDKLASKYKASLVNISRKIYWCLPPHTRPMLTKFVFGVAGKVFKNTSQYERWLNSPTSNTIYDTKIKKQQLTLLSTIPSLHTNPTGKIAVHLHLYYMDLAEKFTRQLKSMPFSYDLFISVTDSKNKSQTEHLFSSLPNLGKLHIIVVENRGRDLAHFLSTFGQKLSHYDYIAHIHSKKSLYNGGTTDGWLDYLLETLFGNSTNLRKIFHLFEVQKNIGLIYPQNFSNLPYMANSWLANRNRAENLRARLKLNRLPVGYFDFPAGSMFWARTDALMPLFNANFDLEEFEPEFGQTDGTLAHCLERMLSIVTNRQGYDHAILTDEANPSWSPWRFEQYFNRSAAFAAAQICAEETKLVIFDIFDTLLIRPLLDPETIKFLVAKRGENNAAEKYLNYRVAAENIARSKSNRDINLDAIYLELSRISNLTDAELNIFRDAEEMLEENAIYPRPDATYLLKEAEKSGKKVVLASDMFLSKELITRILEKHSISGWHAFYLSNEIGLRKDTGELYHHILKAEAVSPANALMVGDNERSDFQIPCDMGMKFIHVLRPTEIARGTLRFSKIIDFSSADTSIDRELFLGSLAKDHFGNIFYPSYDPCSLVSPDGNAIGHAVLGPLCLSFAQWLAEKANMEKIEKLYFLSREGEFLKEVYDFWRSKTGEGPESEYLTISRRAVTIPSIESINDVFDIAKKTFYSNKLNLFLLERFGLDLTEKDTEYFSSRKLWKRDRMVEVIDENIAHIQPLLEHLLPRILDTATSEKSLLLEYLNSKNLSTVSNNLAVVDVGYAASIQGGLCKLLGKQIHGYYIATNNKAVAVSNKYNVKIEGCFGNFIPENEETLFLLSRSFELEKLLSSDSPQLINYRRKENGGVEAQYRSLSNEERSSTLTRHQIREGAMLFCEGAIEIRSKLLNTYRIPTDIAANIYKIFVQRLSDTEKRIMESLVLDDYYCGRGLVA